MEEGVVDQEIDVEDALEDLGGDSEGEEGLALVTRKILLALRQNIEEHWLRSNIFHTTCTIENRVCNLIIDGGSCENVISQEVVDKLRLQQEDHPNPYKLSWLKKGNDIKVTTRCLVNFSIRKKFQDVVMCDVVKMDACHLLLGRPWQFDRGTLHDGRTNSYTLIKGGKKYTLKPMKEANMAIDYSPTGQEFVTGSYDRTVRIFKDDGGYSLEIYHTQRMQRVFCVKFSCDASYVTSGNDDTNLRLWKAEASEQLGVISIALCPCQLIAVVYIIASYFGPDDVSFMLQLLPREKKRNEYHEAVKNI
ncbi:hypothetical protein FCV25MIE_14173 [Fagus crenata]